MPRLSRRDRALLFSGADDETVEDVAAQSPAVGMGEMGDMGDPALDAGVQLAKLISPARADHLGFCVRLS